MELHKGIAQSNDILYGSAISDSILSNIICVWSPDW